ncbi:hypothetical protein E2C01_033294 [Portunus trituberculatus]|uniref:Uncharacterized protein n=1 Tax=Portunus trituberculatus TaxID=210409 RepID=A0A5B7F321_PORTR|nr:hypothetical protein [Portunus trituberculatus]
MQQEMLKQRPCEGNLFLARSSSRAARRASPPGALGRLDRTRPATAMVTSDHNPSEKERKKNPSNGLSMISATQCLEISGASDESQNNDIPRRK